MTTVERLLALRAVLSASMRHVRDYLGIWDVPGSRLPLALLWVYKMAGRVST